MKFLTIVYFLRWGKNCQNCTPQLLQNVTVANLEDCFFTVLVTLMFWLNSTILEQNFHCNCSIKQYYLNVYQKLLWTKKYHSVFTNKNDMINFFFLRLTSMFENVKTRKRRKKWLSTWKALAHITTQVHCWTFSIPYLLINRI